MPQAKHPLLSAEGCLVDGAFSREIVLPLLNSGDHLARAIGARPYQVVRSVIYVVSEDTSVLSAAWHQLTVSVIGSAFSTASILLGVRCLGFSGQLVEVDLTAAL